MVKIFITILCSLLFWGCTCPSEQLYQYSFVNDSGQRVAVVLNELDNALPDSLVINSGKTYDWENTAQAGGFFPIRVIEEIVVYFGDDVKVVYADMQGRSPSNYDNFVRTKIGENFYVAIYTFTKADYEYALISGAVE